MSYYDICDYENGNKLLEFIEIIECADIFENNEDQKITCISDLDIPKIF